MLTTVKSQKRIGLALLVVLVAGLVLAWLLPNGPLSQPKAAATTANDAIPAYTDQFRWGTNMGYRNQNWTDSQLSDLVSGLNMNSFRVSLPENYFTTWGWDIAQPNMVHYQANNLKNLTAFLGTPSRAHSTAPSSVADWELDYYSPKNLYEPIWNADGSVNQNNYWAAYVAKTVSLYKPYVHTWEVWNEPDLTDSTAPDSAWWTRAPTPSEMKGWHDNVYSYVRLMRISYEVIKKTDPTALVATAGFGYESFLDAVMRYTDNPNMGTVDAANYPLKGGAYFDVMSFHYYPQYETLDLATQVWNKKHDSDNALDNMITYRNNFKSVLSKYGYGTTYPSKYFMITETGFSSKPKTGDAGGMDLLRNYMMKLQVVARVNDLKQIHTYMLTDEEPDGSLTDTFKHMGAYYDVLGLANPSQATRKPAAYGMQSVTRSLEGATYDAAATAALNLPALVRGAVFQNNGQRVTILWAKTDNESEAVSASFALPATTSLTLRDWQWAQNNATQTLNPVNGKIQLTLTGAPIILVGGSTPPGGGNPTATPVPPTATPTQPAATATPTQPAATATPTKPAATATPTQPGATATPTKPAATATPTSPAATATPTKPAATATPTLPPPGGGSVPPQKLAISRVLASSADDGNPGENVADNNTNSFWKVSNKPASAWVRLDLGAIKRITEVKYFVYGTGHAKNTLIQYSNDGENWTTFANANNINTGRNWGWNSLAVNQISARYVRFYLDNPNKEWELGWYSEMQVWGR